MYSATSSASNVYRVTSNQTLTWVTMMFSWFDRHHLSCFGTGLLGQLETHLEALCLSMKPATGD